MNTGSSSGQRSSRMFRSLLPAVFIAAVGITIYLLVYFLYPTASDAGLGGAGDQPATTRGDISDQPGPSSGNLPAAIEAEVPARSTAPVRSADRLLSETSPAVAASQFLGDFLKAADAASRVGMVEPEVDLGELKGTLLGGPLPEVAQVFPEAPRRDTIEGFTDFPYRVSFQFMEGRLSDFSVLVRQRSGQTPKVFLPAFLDLVGGRLEAFTRQPNKDDPTRFYVILEPVVGCHEKDVPNADRKFTLKLLPSNVGRETARAYSSTESRLRALVQKPDYPIRWGTRVPATVTIQWNHSEDPEKPYLEVIDINSPDWNP